MTQFEIHTITPYEEDLGVMIFENGETAVFQSEKLAQRVADGMNEIRRTKGCGIARHEYVVVKKEI